MSTAGASAPRRGQHRPHVHAAQAAVGARALGGRGRPGTPREARPDPRHRLPPAEPAADPDRRAAHAEPVPVHAASRRREAALPHSRRCWRPRSARCRASRTSPATCSSRTRRSTSRSTATRPRRWASRRRRSRRRCTTPTARGRSPRSTRPTTSTRSSWSCCRSTSCGRSRSRCSTSQSTSGKLVPLSAVARLESGFGPLTVNHSGQLPSVTISFNLTPGVPLGDAVNARHQPRRGTSACPPPSRTSFQGAAQAFQASLAGLGLLLVMAILVIYMVLGILYESFIHPLTILSGLPFAGFGALLTLLIFRVHAEPLRLRRDHHAGRPGEEERHHDDRLRPRGAAPRRQERAATRSTRRA